LSRKVIGGGKVKFDYIKFNEILLSQGLMLKELSEKCGIAEALLSRYKNNRAKPGIKNLCKLAKALGCEAKNLMSEV